MRYPVSEKLEIIRLVEQSHLGVRPTLEKLGIPKTTFYRWYGFVTLIRRSTCRTGGGRLCRQGDMVPRRNCRDAEQSVGPS